MLKASLINTINQIATVIIVVVIIIPASNGGGFL
jgi:hypothetical protein